MPSTPAHRSAHRSAAVGVAAAILGLGLGGLAEAPAVAASSATTVLSNDVLHGLAGLQSTPTAPGTPVQVGITLSNPHAAAQDAAYRAIYTPGSPLYHHFMTADEVARDFGLPETTYAAVLSWATRDGMKPIFAPTTRESLTLSGTAAQAESTFSVHLRTYSGNGTTFYANSDAPTVPAGLGVAGVIGLNNLLRSHTFNHRPSSSAPHGPAPQQSLCAGTSCVGLTTPQDLWSIYGQPTSLADPTQDFGQGQQMAVLGEGQVSGPLGDLRAFEKEFSLPQIPITIRSLGDTFTDTSASGEWDIDSQSSTGMSPKAYGETWYFANDLTDSSVLMDITAFATDANGPMQANASFGECEQDPVSTADGNAPGGVSTPAGGGAGNAGAAFTQASDNALQQATLQGKTLFSSTGDTGSSCPLVYAAVIGAGNGVANQGYPETNYPASSPYVTAVGGTVLYGTTNTATPPASNSTRSTEYSWNFTGGGNTFYIAEPAYQQGIGLLDNQPCVSQPDGTPYASPTQPCRGIPDVAAQSGDVVSNGMAVTMAGANDSQGAGTSLASPLWMGMWTRIQAAARTQTSGGQFTNGFANPALYKVGLNAAQDLTDFFDLGGGTNSPSNSNGYYANLARNPTDPSGWDYLSGLGSPNVTALGKDVTGNTTFAPTDPVAAPAPQDCGQVGLVPCATGSGGGIVCNNPLDLWNNPPHTASDPLGNSDPQLSLLQGGLTLTASGSTLRALLTVTNLSAAAPTGSGAAEWYALWTYNGTTYFANAEVSGVPGSTPTYHDGTVALVGNSHQYKNSTNTNDTGSFTTGPHGVVEIDVPLANVGNPPANSVFSSPSGETWIEIGSTVTGGLLEKVDTGGPSCEYVLGEAPPPSLPDAPFAPLLPIAGIGALLSGVVMRRRRRI
ncbi:MAG: S53 family peptidase [Candidatus Dormibacteria bacterium]